MVGKARQAAIQYSLTASERKPDIMAKVRGLMLMVIGATLIGFGMFGISEPRAALLVGLSTLLIGFTLLVGC
jgi:hypothetical protein